METNETTETPRPTPQEAIEKIVAEVQANGMMKMIDLDPYFGTVDIPLQAEIEALVESHGEAFAFFKAFMDDLQEEIEIHFETTEMYEDEDFDQFVEDCRIIKARYTEDLNARILPELLNFAKTVKSA
jgi:hypothetical protein